MVQNIINAVLNMIFISMPESFVWLLITLMLSKRFDLLDRYRWKSNLKYFLIPVLPTAFYINFLRYILHMPRMPILFGCIFIFYSLTLYILKKNLFVDEKLPYLKTLLFVYIGIFIIAMTELIYIPIILYITHLSMDAINQNILINFMLSLPSRVFQILIIITILHKYNKIKLFSNIIRDKVLLIITVLFLSIILLIVFIATKIIHSYCLILNCSLYSQILIGITITIILTLIIFLYLIPINYLINKLFLLNKSHQNMFDDDYMD